MTSPKPPHKTTLPRRAGVLLPLFSVQTTHDWGVGEIPDLIPLAEWAHRAGLSVLQLLPVNQVASGETSPYAAATAFALDPVYLGIDRLEDFAGSGGRARLSSLERQELDTLAEQERIRWPTVRRLKEKAFDQAFAWFYEKEWRTGSSRRKALEAFREQHRDWLEDHALFTVLHAREKKAWWQWPEPLRRRDTAALDKLRESAFMDVLKVHYLQWLADEQWHAARREANALGVALKGDLPFMVGADSADVWSASENFRLDRRVGTPPDAFSETGQDWGLPAYDWERLEKSGFAWLRARAERSGSLFDLYRIDHVIGLYRTYTRAADGPEDAGFSPEKEKDQIRLGETILELFKGYGEVVAEDLGMVPEFLPPSLEKLGIPGYRVLRWQMGKDGEIQDPETWPELSVATTGTHDLEPNADWYDALSKKEKKAFLRLPTLAHLDPAGSFTDGVRDALLETVYGAASELAINPLQDLLGRRERVNVPGTVTDSNWTYRMRPTLSELGGNRAIRDRLLELSLRTRRFRVMPIEQTAESM